MPTLRSGSARPRAGTASLLTAAVATVAAVATTVAVAVPVSASASVLAPVSAPMVPAWREVPGPALPEASSLSSVAVVSGADAWAVGSRGTVGTDAERPLVARWNGRGFTAVPAPGDTQLRGVAAAGSTDVWAVGSSSDGHESSVLHWNGLAWSEVAHVAATPTKPLALGSVAALATDDVWAVGFRGTLDGEAHGHTQHWDGTRWTEVPIPEPAGAFVTVLSSVSGTSGDDVWAAGFGFGETGFIPWFARWDGTRWSLVEAPATIAGGYTDVQAVAGGGFVAVGADASPADPAPVPVIATFDRGVWRQEALPALNGELDAVTPDGSGGFWAVGTVTKGGHDGRPLVLRRSQGTWSTAATPVTELGSLRDVQVVPGQARAFAVGRTGVTDETVENLALRYS